MLTDQDTAESTTAEYSRLTTATVEIRWDEKAGLRQDAVGFQGPRIGQILWRAAARVQRTQYESGESPGV